MVQTATAVSNPGKNHFSLPCVINILHLYGGVHDNYVCGENSIL